MPKKRSKRTLNNNSKDIFLSLKNTENKITKEELNNLENSIQEAFNKFLYKVCSKYASCPSPFFEDLISFTKELPKTYSSTLKFWVNRIYYLYETVDTFSTGTGKNKLKGDYINWDNIFENITTSIKNSIIPEMTINQYKLNLFNLRNGLLGSFTSKNNLFSEFLTKITLPSSDLPNSFIFDFIKAFQEEIKKFDEAMFVNIKQGMINPYNVIDDSILNQTATSLDLINSTQFPSLDVSSKPEIKVITSSAKGISQDKSADFFSGLV